MKHHLLRFLVGVVCGLITRPASAEMSANEMIRLFRNGDVGAQFFFSGIGNAFSWANASLRTERKAALFLRT
jgi:hypothetical protein